MDINVSTSAVQPVRETASERGKEPENRKHMGGPGCPRAAEAEHDQCHAKAPSSASHQASREWKQMEARDDPPKPRDPRVLKRDLQEQP